jgi:integrase/recombinase XerD
VSDRRDEQTPRPQPGRAADPPTDAEVAVLFAGWREELVTCRKFAPAARNYVAAKLMSQVGLRVNEACHLELADIKWELGRFGKLHVRVGKRRPRQRTP